MKLALGESEYDVGRLVALMEKYKIYLCKNADDQLLFLQIACENCADHNSTLDRSVYALHRLKERSDEVEGLYTKNNPGKLVNYDRLFPQVVQSERSGDDQGNRTVSILSIKMDPQDTTDIDRMVPLQKLLVGQKVDEPTSAWIMGRFLKLFTFLEDAAMSIDIKPENVLLSGPEQHHNVVLFDWSELEYENEAGWRSKIASAAETTLAALGLQEDWAEVSDLHPEYINFILELTKSSSGYPNPTAIHKDFYEIVDGIWGKGYIPMQVIPK